MSTLGQPVPPRPAIFSPELAPAGVEVSFVSFWQDRPIIVVKSALAHTNAASNPSNVDGSKRWAEAAPGSNTLPHYQIDRDGRAGKFIPSNRRGIGNATVTSSSSAWDDLTPTQQADISAHGQIRDWSLVIETQDLGTIADPGLTLSGWTDPQGEKLATVLAYESIVHNFPLVRLPAWWEAGVGTHTEPFTYPYTTLFQGKTCPGPAKKAGFWQWVLPRAVEIQAAWTEGELASSDEILAAITELEGKVDGSRDRILGALNTFRENERRRFQTLRRMIADGTSTAELLKALDAFEAELK